MRIRFIEDLSSFQSVGLTMSSTIRTPSSRKLRDALSIVSREIGSRTFGFRWDNSQYHRLIKWLEFSRRQLRNSQGPTVPV